MSPVSVSPAHFELEQPIHPQVSYFTSCIFEAKEVFLLPSLEVDELFLELEERRLTEPLEQTTSSEKETREVRPEPGADPEADEEPGTELEVVDERRLQDSVGWTGTTT